MADRRWQVDFTLYMEWEYTKVDTESNWRDYRPCILWKGSLNIKTYKVWSSVIWILGKKNAALSEQFQYSIRKSQEKKSKSQTHIYITVKIPGLVVEVCQSVSVPFVYFTIVTNRSMICSEYVMIEKGLWVVIINMM